jgi:putative SOS response-associated peptidase YedK
MVMTQSEGTEAAPVHERMPVLLSPQDQAVWTDGGAGDALTLCRGWQGPLAVERTSQPWAKGAISQPDLF